jgi:Putative peptidoglycan binding domain
MDSLAPKWFAGDTIFPASEPQRGALRQAQRVLRLDETGDMDEATRAALRGFQGLFHLRISGMLDLQTAIKLEQVRSQHA